MRLEIGGVHIHNLQEAEGLEAQGFLSQDELEKAKQKFETTKPRQFGLKKQIGTFVRKIVENLPHKT